MPPGACQCLGRLFWWPDAGYPNWRQGSQLWSGVEVSAEEEGKSLPLGIHSGCYITLQGVSVTVQNDFPGWD